MQVNAIQTRIFKERENLVEFIQEYVPSLSEGSVLVVTSKIVALAEGRTAVLGAGGKEALIKAESELALKTKHTWLTLRDGMFVASAGIDESNADGRLILLPKDSYRSASILRTKLMKMYNVKKLAIIIPDSRTMPLRAGAIGVAVGYAGMKGLRDYRGTRDMFARKFVFERAAIVDSLAAAATLAMGEGAECRPLAVVTDAPVEFTDRVNRSELLIPLVDDMWRPLFGKISTKTIRKKK
jgi:coenzyme F420-0:L-glutamate ligase